MFSSGRAKKSITAGTHSGGGEEFIHLFLFVDVSPSWLSRYFLSGVRWNSFIRWFQKLFCDQQRECIVCDLLRASSLGWAPCVCCLDSYLYLGLYTRHESWKLRFRRRCVYSFKRDSGECREKLPDGHKKRGGEYYILKIWGGSKKKMKVLLRANSCSSSSFAPISFLGNAPATKFCRTLSMRLSVAKECYAVPFLFFKSLIRKKKTVRKMEVYKLITL
jgi:hypothetical protein